MNDPVTRKSIYPMHGNNAAVVIDRSAYHSILYYALRLDGLALRLSSPSHKFSLTAPHIMLSSVHGIAVQEPGVWSFTAPLCSPAAQDGSFTETENTRHTLRTGSPSAALSLRVSGRTFNASSSRTLKGDSHTHYRRRGTDVSFMGR